MSLTSKQQEKLNYLFCKASYSGDLEEVKKLIIKGADINAFDNEGIRIASCYGHIDVVKYLTENGADANKGLDLASKHGHLEIVKYLHQNGADVTTNDNNAIKLASSEGRLKMIKYLLENGADLDMAIEHSYDETKEELISHKEKMLLNKDIKEVKQEQQKPKNTMRI